MISTRLVCFDYWLLESCIICFKFNFIFFFYYNFVMSDGPLNSLFLPLKYIHKVPELCAEYSKYRKYLIRHLVCWTLVHAVSYPYPCLWHVRHVWHGYYSQNKVPMLLSLLLMLNLLITLKSQDLLLNV